MASSTRSPKTPARTHSSRRRRSVVSPPLPSRPATSQEQPVTRRNRIASKQSRSATRRSMTAERVGLLLSFWQVSGERLPDGFHDGGIEREHGTSISCRVGIATRCCPGPPDNWWIYPPPSAPREPRWRRGGGHGEATKERTLPLRERPQGEVLLSQSQAFGGLRRSRRRDAVPAARVTSAVSPGSRAVGAGGATPSPARRRARCAAPPPRHRDGPRPGGRPAGRRRRSRRARSRPGIRSR